MATGLDTFRGVVTDFRSIGGLATKGAIALPLADLLLDVGPPWPSHLASFAAVAELIVLIVVFEFWYTSPRFRQRRRMIMFGLWFVVSLFGYLFLASEFIAVSPTGDRFALGYEVREDVATVLELGEPPVDLLPQAEYQPERIWTVRSITMVRLGLLAGWFAAFSCLAAFLGVFVVIQRRRPR